LARTPGRARRGDRRVRRRCRLRGDRRGRGGEDVVTEDRPDIVASTEGDGELDSPAPEELLARVQDAERERDEVLDNLRRVAADFDNYRKRVAREQDQLYARAGERVVA